MWNALIIALALMLQGSGQGTPTGGDAQPAQAGKIEAPAPPQMVFLVRPVVNQAWMARVRAYIATTAANAGKSGTRLGLVSVSPSGPKILSDLSGDPRTVTEGTARLTAVLGGQPSPRDVKSTLKKLSWKKAGGEKRHLIVLGLPGERQLDPASLGEWQDDETDVSYIEYDDGTGFTNSPIFVEIPYFTRLNPDGSVFQLTQWIPLWPSDPYLPPAPILFPSYPKSAGFNKSGSLSNIHIPRAVVVREKRDFEILWREHAGNRQELQKSIPLVDLEHGVVVAVFAGDEPAAGYLLTVRRVHETPQEVQVYVDLQAPEAGALRYHQITQPWLILEIPRRDKPVRVFYRASGSGGMNDVPPTGNRDHGRDRGHGGKSGP